MVSEKLNRTNTGRLTDGFGGAWGHLGCWWDGGVMLELMREHLLT
ncbi:hypothetical protein [Nostoc sp. C057]|nr:hypothetical protein [Nostoc sp. C057]